MESPYAQRTAHGAQDILPDADLEIYRKMQSPCHIPQTDHGGVILHGTAHLHARSAGCYRQAGNSGIRQVSFNQLRIVTGFRRGRRQRGGHGAEDDGQQRQQDNTPAKPALSLHGGGRRHLHRSGGKLRA